MLDKEAAVGNFEALLMGIVNDATDKDVSCMRSRAFPTKKERENWEILQLLDKVEERCI